MKHTVDIKHHLAYEYAQNVQNGTEIAGKDIKIVTKRFLYEIDHPDEIPYFFDYDELYKINWFLKNMNMATGPAKGEKIYDALVGFQWFFIANILCWKRKKEPDKRRYNTATLLIARKNSKTFMSALIFILLLLLEPKYSEFYSVAPDKELSGIIKDQIEELIGSSPRIRQYFKILRSEIVCIPKKSTFKNLANSNNRLDGRQPYVYLCDETGALPNRYPLDAMQTGQQLVKNPLGIIISTAYDTIDNPMTQEVNIAESLIQDGDNYDPTYFALIYKPDNPKDWMTDETQVLQANPLVQNIPEAKISLEKDWKKAIVTEELRPAFLTKRMNVFIDGDAGESFVTEAEIDACETNDKYDWNGRKVYVGLDFAESNDNFGLAMVTYDDSIDKLVAKAWAFYPKDREAAKSKVEGVDYAHASNVGWAVPMGHATIDYAEAEQFFFSLEKTYGVQIEAFGYDKWNALSSVAKFQAAGYVGVEVAQNASGVYPATKLLKESILNKTFGFEKNDLFKQNFLNATMMTDMNLSYYLNKKKSKGKIDMVAALIDALAVYQQQQLDNIPWSNSGIEIV